MEVNLEEALKQIVSEVLEIDLVEVYDNISPETVEKWDSFNHLVIISAIEERLSIVFTSDDVEKIKNFGELRRIAAKRGRSHV